MEIRSVLFFCEQKYGKESEFMKVKRIVSALICCFVIFPAVLSFGQEAKTSEPASQIPAAGASDLEKEETGKNPAIFAAKTEYEFPLVLEGKHVTHEFAIQNKGDAELEIREVKTG